MAKTKSAPSGTTDRRITALVTLLAENATIVISGARIAREIGVSRSTVWRWVQRYAPILNQRIRREVRHPNRSWRIDETYIRMAGRWVYLYRAVDSCGETIEFMLSPKRDLVAAKHFLQLAL